MQYFTTCKLAIKVGANCFYPEPNVDSAVVLVKHKEEINSISKEDVLNALGTKLALTSHTNGSILIELNLLHIIFFSSCICKKKEKDTLFLFIKHFSNNFPKMFRLFHNYLHIF